MPRITFIEADGTTHAVEAADGLSLMEAARDHDVPGIEAECGGAGACATCHVYIDPDWTDSTGDAGDVECDMLELVDERCDDSRLSCQIRLSPAMDGLIVRLPESQGF